MAVASDSNMFCLIVTNVVPFNFIFQKTRKKNNSSFLLFSFRVFLGTIWSGTLVDLYMISRRWAHTLRSSWSRSCSRVGPALRYSSWSINHSLARASSAISANNSSSSSGANPISATGIAATLDGRGAVLLRTSQNHLSK